jgi:hypothetical protein
MIDEVEDGAMLNVFRVLVLDANAYWHQSLMELLGERYSLETAPDVEEAWPSSLTRLS